MPRHFLTAFRKGTCGSAALLAVVFFPLQGWAYDYSVLRINEVISSNKSQPPADGVGKFRDMVEIYNSGDEALPLGGSTAEDSLALSGEADPTPLDLWMFPGGGFSNIPPKGYLVVFLDQRPAESLFCQLYSEFSLKSNGTEPLTLWGPVTGSDGDGTPVREIIDQVWLPPLPSDVSFGRVPDGAGPAPVPLESTYDVFNFFPQGSSTFGDCDAVCPALPVLGVCSGAPNGEPGNLPPSINRIGHSTNHPGADEAVELRVRVRDDKEPTPGNIASVLIHYWVDGEPQDPSISMVFDSEMGTASGEAKTPPSPLDRWTEWTGSLPAQPQGSIVQFVFEATDAEGLSAWTPDDLCSDLELDPPADVEGPCDREFGGPGCVQDAADVTCGDNPVKGARYIACKVPFRYVSGYSPRDNLAFLVINEVVPRQDRVLKDESEPDCAIGTLCPENWPQDLPEEECCKYREDFMEIFNSSGTDTIDLSDLWLSDSPFHPHGWQFPAGSSIGPGEYRIVWLDRDGGKCPDPDVFNPPCFWECPDPTDPAAGVYHTNFALNGDQDDLYLFDTKENGFGVIHGVEFQDVPLNKALSLQPSGDRAGSWCIAEPTPLDANAPCDAADPIFLRGDSDGNCGVEITDGIYSLNFLFLGGPQPQCMDAADADDNGVVNITDAIYVLNFLFLGGEEPLPPGSYVPGSDSTPDELDSCVETCGSEV